MKKVVAVLFVLVFCFVAANAMAQSSPPVAGQPAVTQADSVQVTQAPGLTVGVQTTVRPRIVVEPAPVQFPSVMTVRSTEPVEVKTGDNAPLKVDGDIRVVSPYTIPIEVAKVPENPSWCARNLGWCALGLGVLAGASVAALDGFGAFDREVSFK